MKNKGLVTWLVITPLLVVGMFAFAQTKQTDDSRYITHVVNPGKEKIQLYWKDGKGERFGNFQRLKQWLNKQPRQLHFAMNGGMYKADHSPVGLYIESGKVLAPLDTNNNSGNFYLKPNGVFYIMVDDNAVVCNTTNFINSSKIKYATQSGPMLVIDGNIHPAFTKGSTNKTVRNGVGILQDGSVLFALSKEPVNFYDFADYFKRQGCKNALYLDGFVSRMYLPQKKWIQTYGDFGVMIGVTDIK